MNIKDSVNSNKAGTPFPLGKLSALTKRKKQIGSKRPYLILLLPALVIFTVGMVIPLVMGVMDSFTNWDGVSPEKEFIGFDNYLAIFKDSMFKEAFIFTFLFMILNTVLQNVAALLFAVMLDSSIKAKNFYRTIIFAPVLLSPILVGQIWTKMYGTVLPDINEKIGLAIPLNLFSSPDTVLTGLVIANNWQWIGYWMIIYLAGLQAVPKELYEAGSIDGTTTLQKFWHITLPMLAPSITICTIGIATGSLKVFELIVAATNGGPGTSSQSLIMYVYNSAFNAQKAGYASAMSVIFLLILLVFAFVQLKYLRKREVEM